MTAGAVRRTLRSAAGALLLTLFACTQTAPVQRPTHRGEQVGPLPGAPEEEPFVEATAVPPAYPRDKDLIEINLRGVTTNRFFVDGATLTVSPDKVVRFVLVIRTAEGANNVRFSGLHCSEKEWKDYAFARADHTWAVVRDPQWQPVLSPRINNYQDTLYKDYFCTSGVVASGTVGNAEKLVERLKHPPQPDDRVPRYQQ
ncbi:MAG TPA: CNP1-like family protein [Burkholderiales bacterium]|nr:CNP1-like family protein [Burkholderiales bacterium]